MKATVSSVKVNVGLDGCALVIVMTDTDFVEGVIKDGDLFCIGQVVEVEIYDNGVRQILSSVK